MSFKSVVKVYTGLHRTLRPCLSISTKIGARTNDVIQLHCLWLPIQCGYPPIDSFYILNIIRMAEHKEVIKQRKIQATVQNFACVHFLHNVDCFLDVHGSLCLIQTSSFSRLLGAFVCLIEIHEGSTQIPVATLEVSIWFFLLCGVESWHSTRN